MTTNFYTPRKIKPALVGGKVADFADIDGEISLTQISAATIRMLLSLTSEEVNGLLIGQPIVGRTLIHPQ